MPLTQKGSKIKAAMVKEYGEKKGTSVFYASRNAGKISGVDRGKDALNAAMASGQREAEAQRQARAMLEGKHVSGRDRGRVWRR